MTKDQNELKIRFNKNYYELNDNDQATISCKTYPKSNSNIEWLINDQNANDFKNLYVNKDKVFIINASQSLHGVLTCRAKNKDGKIFEDTAVIRMNKKKALFVDTYPKLSRPNIGDRIQMTCILERLKDNQVLDAIEFEWKKDGVSVRESNSLTVDREGNLNLTITSLQDTGLYTCQAFDIDLKSNVGKIYVDVFGEKKEASQVQIKSERAIQDKKIYVKQGDNLTLECIIKSNEPVVKPTWYKVDGSLSSEFYSMPNNVSHITIKNIQLNNAGKYVCIENFNLYQISDYVEIIVDKYKPIEIQLEFSEEENLYVIECFVNDGYPNPQLEWIKAPKDLGKYTTNQYSKHIEILIKKNDTNVYGQYECRGWNKYDSKSKIYELERKNEVIRVEEISVNIPEKKIVMKEGASTKIDCNLNGNPSLIKNINWYLNQTLINSNQHSNFKAFDNILIINNIQVDQKGELKCVLRIDSIFKTDSTVLEVKEKEYKVEIEPKDPQFYEGDYVEFKCNIKSKYFNTDQKKFKFTWYKLDNIIGNEQVLVLGRINLSSAGDYYCSVESLRKFQFSEKAKSKLITLSIPMTIGYLGENKTLECGLNFSNYTRYEWYKFYNQKEIELEKKRQFYTGNLLHLGNLKIEDRGDYVCKAYYSGTEFDIKYIRVEVNKKEKPEILISPDQIVIDSYGKFKSIKCEVIAGFPNPEIEWRRLDKKLMSNKIEIKNGVLNMKNIDPYDYGEYECVAKNEFGEDLKTITIKKPDLLY